MNLTMGCELYQNLLERLDDPSIKPVEVDVNDPNRRCELIDGTPIHPNLALMVMAVAEFKRIVVDTKSRPIDVSVKARCHPPWMKELLLIIARGRCRTSGRTAPYSWLQADHIVPYSRAGETSVVNGQILCGPDNKWKRDFHQHDAA